MKKSRKVKIVEPNMPLVEVLDKDFYVSSMTVADIQPEDKNRKPVEVTLAIAGKPMLIFEYNDGEKFGVCLTRLFNEVDKVFLSEMYTEVNSSFNTEPTEKPVENSTTKFVVAKVMKGKFTAKRLNIKRKR